MTEKKESLSEWVGFGKKDIEGICLVKLFFSWRAAARPGAAV